MDMPQAQIFFKTILQTICRDKLKVFHGRVPTGKEQLQGVIILKHTKKWMLAKKVIAMMTAACMLGAMLPAPAGAVSGDYPDIIFTFYDDEILADDDWDDDDSWYEDDFYSIDGTELTIYESGTYTLTGSCENGSVIIDENAEDVTLVLDELELSSSYTAPIVCDEDSEVFIELEGDSILIDDEDPDDEDYDDAFEGAAIKVKSGASLTIDGSGTLEIDASSCKNGIKGDSLSTITIEDGEFIIDAANNALSCDHQLIISGGDFEITSENEGLKAAPDEDDEDSDGSIEITGGTFTIDAADDTIHGSSEVTITDGTFTITAGDDAIHSDFELNIGEEDSDGPDITIKECVEGFEGAEVNLYSGSGSIVSSDDGINAANGDLTDYDFELNIYGGSWYVDAQGDGLDSNGDITISGGTTESYGASGGSGGNTALDSDGEITISGGTVLAVDSSGITPAGTYLAFGNTTGRNKTQENNTDTTEVSVSEGSELAICDSSGRLIYETESIRDASWIMLASDELEEGQTYTLYIDGDEAASVSAVTTESSSGNRGDGKENENTNTNGNQPETTVQPTLPVLQMSFQDVQTTDWFFEAVAWAVHKGITAGTSTNLFSPETPCTRGQLVVLLWKAAGSPAYSNGLNPFLDVTSDAYYHDAVMWAAEQGITSGVNASAFSPDTAVTRGQTVAFLYRAANSPSPTGICPFYDVSAADYYASAVRWAVAQDITAGTSATLFSPDMSCTRSQIVSFLYRWQNPA